MATFPLYPLREGFIAAVYCAKEENRLIQLRSGNITEQRVEALVNPINCHGMLEPGPALQFREAFPANFVSYRRACRLRKIPLEEPYVVPLTPEEKDRPRYIFNLPIKRTGRRPAQPENIRKGLAALVRTCRDLGVHSIALPPLGMEPGGLDWDSIQKILTDAFAKSGLEVTLVHPAQES